MTTHVLRCTIIVEDIMNTVTEDNMDIGGVVTHTRCAVINVYVRVGINWHTHTSPVKLLSTTARTVLLCFYMCIDEVLAPNCITLSLDINYILFKRRASPLNAVS